MENSKKTKQGIGDMVGGELIHKKMIDVMRNIGAIGKNQKNQSQGFNFRGIDTVYNELHSILSAAGVFTVPEVIEERSEDRKTAKGYNLIYRILKIKYKFYAADGSHVTATVIGEGMDSGDKGANKAQSVAHKYALLQTFCIPTQEMIDPDATTPDPSVKGNRRAAGSSKTDTRGQAPDPARAEAIKAFLAAFNKLPATMKTEARVKFSAELAKKTTAAIITATEKIKTTGGKK